MSYSAQTTTAVRQRRPDTRAAFAVGLARSPAAIREAQRLRYEIFAREVGARLHNTLADHDHDDYDDFCQHLLVRDAASGQIAGYTRILTDRQARKAGGFYSQSEFDLAELLRQPGRVMEIGRTCIHADYRNGAAIATLWAGLAAFIVKHGFDYVIGCASIPLAAGAGAVQALAERLLEYHGLAHDLRATPRCPLPRQDGTACADLALPPLLKAYLRIGAQIASAPCLDADFNVADVLIWLPTAQLERRYARHYLKKHAQ
ncbi:MAG: GNAT family N-acyltransferase [Gammaproteobacteria bacterium]